MYAHQPPALIILPLSPGRVCLACTTRTSEVLRLVPRLEPPVLFLLPKGTRRARVQDCRLPTVAMERADLVRVAISSFNTGTQGDCNTLLFQKRFLPATIRSLLTTAAVLDGVRSVFHVFTYRLGTTFIFLASEREAIGCTHYPQRRPHRETSHFKTEQLTSRPMTFYYTLY